MVKHKVLQEKYGIKKSGQSDGKLKCVKNSTFPEIAQNFGFSLKLPKLEF
jgi:hypothetical protein